MSANPTPWGDGGSRFATTRWSLVAAAGDVDGSAERDEALATLCRTYWLPLYAYVRRRVASEHEARDLTQGFFTRLLERNDIGAARPDRGRFRAYLITAFKHFLANEWDAARALKRGGGQAPLSLDFERGETSLSLLPGDAETPEHIYERQWVATLLSRVFERLRAEAAEQDRSEQFEALCPSIAGTAPRGLLKQVAERFGLSDGAARMAAQRLRERYRELLREEVAQTLTDPSEVDDEIASLFAAVRPSPRIL